MAPFNPPPKNRKISGDFHRPYETQKFFTFHHSPKMLPILDRKNAPHSRQEKPIDKTLCTCYNTWELTEKFPISYRGVEQLEARRAHNPEVVGSSPASATIKNSRFLQKTAVFLTFWRLQKLQTLRLGVYLGFTPVEDSVFPTFWAKMIFEVKQHFGEKVPESCIQNGKALFLLYNSTEYSE